MKAQDRAAIARGVPSITLMERAAQVVFEEVAQRYPPSSQQTPTHIVVLCGPGNNGGDGLALAGLLREHPGYSVKVIATRAQKVTDEWRVMAAKLPEILVYPGRSLALGELAVASSVENATNISYKIISQQELEDLLKDSDLIIDALLGIGQVTPPRGVVEELLTIYNTLFNQSSGIQPPEKKPPVLALDIPTGVCSDTGALYPSHIGADCTVAIELPKRGMLTFPGREAAGAIVVKPIGICPPASHRPNDLPSSASTPEIEFSLFTSEEAQSSLIRNGYPLAATAHKGTRGRVLIVGGSLRMPGAPALSALGALRGGAGVVSVAGAPHWGTFSYLPPEIMRVPVTGHTSDTFTERDIEEIASALNGISCIVLGPGLGEFDTKKPEASQPVAAFTEKIFRLCVDKNIPTVVDASALRYIPLSSYPNVGAQIIVTPHPGEAAGMLATTSGQIQRDRFSAVRALYEKTRCVTLLKGAGTLTYYEGRGTLIGSGTPFLATAGSGDVLSGLLAALLARGISACEAAPLGAYLHGKAGEIAEASRGNFVASDLPAEFAKLLATLPKQGC